MSRVRNELMWICWEYLIFPLPSFCLDRWIFCEGTYV
uniref:Uncharacterized protein n=1 Tax=Setaria italica TaxID=4555 RepID=K3Y431_SETIT